MRLHRLMAGFSLSLLMMANSQAAQIPVMEQVQVPLCLAAKLSQNYKVLAENPDFKILEIPSGDIGQLVRLADEVRCGRFINVSYHLATSNLEKKQGLAKQLLSKPYTQKRAKVSPDYKIKHLTAVKEALAEIDSNNIWQTLTHLTAYYNRSATQETGVRAAEWLKVQFEGLALAADRKDTAAYFVETGPNYKQPSLVTVIGTEFQEPAIVIGAHIDTLDERMPGAGDDASGSAIVMEMARILLESKNTFKRPIYVIWYAAEERGLVGSQYVVRDFLSKSISVRAAIQFDMTGYRAHESDPTMWVFRDYTDKNLSDFIAKLIKTYIKVPVGYSRCGYGCSDHASWTAAGIPAAFPFETSFEEHNPHIHTSGDTLSLLNTDHLVNFTKLALAFAIELAS